MFCVWILMIVYYDPTHSICCEHPAFLPSSPQKHCIQHCGRQWPVVHLPLFPHPGATLTRVTPGWVACRALDTSPGMFSKFAPRHQHATPQCGDWSRGTPAKPSCQLGTVRMCGWPVWSWVLGQSCRGRLKHMPSAFHHSTPEQVADHFTVNYFQELPLWVQEFIVMILNQLLSMILSLDKILSDSMNRCPKLQ